jgi:hypothetical protein
VREDLRTLTKDYDKSENDLKALQSVGQVNENHPPIIPSILGFFFRSLEKY